MRLGVPSFSGVSLDFQKQKSPMFGCRMAATISSGDGGKEQEQFQKDLYLEDLPQRVFVQRDTGRDGARHPFNLEDLLMGSVIPNTDGHGFAAYKQGALVKHYRSAEPMAEMQNGKMILHSEYARLAQAVLQEKPDVMVGHVRAKVGTPSCVENAHPFKHSMGDDQWSLVHNGSDNAAKSEQSKALVWNELGFKVKNDTTWAETSFMNFMSRLNQEKRRLHGIESGANLDNERIKQIFAETVYELDTQSIPKHNPFRDKLNPSQLGFINPAMAFFNLKGAVRHAPSSTFITTNGKLTLAVSSQRVLHLGKIQYANGEYDYVLVSEIPKKLPLKAEKCNWLVLPPHHILSIEKQENGELNAMLEPIETLLPGKK